MHMDPVTSSDTPATSVILGAVIVAWFASAVAGLVFVWAYDNGPGVSGRVTTAWPADSKLTRAIDRPTLVVLAHPQCSCTRATLGELAEALARAQSRPQTYVVFLKPSSMPEGWEKSDLWNSAAALPDTIVVKDDDGREATRFGAATSGQTMLYDVQGMLLFSGGITGSRGHAGDNAGRSSVVDLLNGRAGPTSSTNVFGCSLFSSAKS
jgi:hypothetical protein